MNFLKELLNQISSIWKKLENTQKITIGITLIAFLITFLFLINWAKQPEYAVLYSNLSTEDAGTIIEKLKETKIPYRLKEGGKTILIPSSQVYETRIDLAIEGVPKGREVGFEIFDKTNLGITSFMEKVNYQRALQGELSRTIQSLDEVQQARVHLVIPEPSPFIEEEKSPTAAVVLRLNPGVRLKKSQVSGIVYLVASSVEGLEPENITIIDKKGNMLFGGGKESSSYLSANQLELKRSIEQYLADKIYALLTPVLGPNKVVTKVNAEINFDQIQQTKEEYNPKGKVIQNEVREEESKKEYSSTAGGAPGVKSNVGEGIPSVSAHPQEERRERSTIQYALNKTVENIIKQTGDIEKLSVGVIIDGDYRITSEGKKEYVPRTKEEMDKYTSIIKQAIGYDESRGDAITVTNVAFDTSYLEEEKISMERMARQEFLKYLIKYMVIGISIFILFLLLKSIFKEVEVKREKVVSLEEKTPEKEEVIFPSKELIRQQVSKVIQEKPEQAVDILRLWLKERGNGNK